MAYGDIHNKTGTVCKAASDESCPLSTDGGHSADLARYAENHGVDSDTLRGLVENAKMAPQAALDLMGSGKMSETPPPITKAPYRAPEPRIRSVQEQLQETPQERYGREMTAYKIAQVAYENKMLADYADAIEVAKQSPFAPQPQQPPLRTVYPKSFEAYDELPKDFLSDSLPEEIQNQPGGAGLWEEYLRKRKQLGDVRHSTGNSADRVLYL